MPIRPVDGICGPRQGSNQSPCAVDPDRLAFGNGIDQLDLETFALGREHVARLVAAPDLLGERLVARDDLAHLRLDRRKILRRERLVAVEVVIEAVLDHRSDRHLGAGKEILHRLRQHMGAVMPDQLQRLRILAGDEADRRIGVELVRKIAELAVDRHRDGLLFERLGNRGGDLAPGHAGGEGPFCTIGKCQGDHGSSSPAHSCQRCR